MSPKFYICLILGICSLSVVKSGLLNKIRANRHVFLAIERFEQCKENPNTDILFQDIKISQVNATSFEINGELLFQEIIDHKWTLHFSMKKCSDRDNLSSCKRFFEMNTQDVCEVVQAKEQLWTPFIQHINMKEKCPIHKATYPIHDLPINANVIRFLPMDESFFKIRITSEMNNKLIMCLDVDLYTTFE